MRRPPLRALGFPGSSFAQASNSGSSGGDFEVTVTGPGGTGTWLFAVPDGDSESDGTVLLSVADGGVLYAGRVDLSSLVARLGSGSGDADAASASVAWVEVDLSATGVTTITDHWHLHAAGYHWISFAENDGTDDTDTDLWLLKLDPADVRSALDTGASSVAPVAAVLVFSRSDSTALRYDATGTYQTNDHFIVPVPGGIAVAIGYLDNKSLRVITAGVALFPTALGDVAFGGGSSTADDMSPTGSAIPSLDGDWKLLVPNKNSPATTTNSLGLFETDSAFSAASAVDALSDSAYNFQMASFVELANRDLVVVLNRVPTSGYYTSGEAVVQDWGDIVLAVYDADLASEQQSEDVQACAHAALGARPHLSRWDRWLLVCWDTATWDSSTSKATARTSKLRVYLLSGAW